MKGKETSQEYRTKIVINDLQACSNSRQTYLVIAIKPKDKHTYSENPLIRPLYNLEFFVRNPT